MPTSSSDSNAARAWVAMRLVDGLRQGGLEAFYDGHNVKANGEHIDMASIVSAVTAKPHDEWAQVVNTFSASVVSRHAGNGGAVQNRSSPLGNLSRTRSNTSSSFLDVSASGQRPAKSTTARASSLAGALELRPLPEAARSSESAPVLDLTEPPPIPVDQPPSTPIELVPEPTVDAGPLAAALASMELRVIANEFADNIPTEAKIPSPLPDTCAALSLGDSWVTDADLATWGIDRTMATDVVQSRVRDFASPSVQLVIDTGCRLFVIETKSREIAATVFHLDQYVPVRADDGVWVALGGERVAIVALDEVLTCAAVNLLIDSALAEFAASSGRLRPALYRWTDGELGLEVADLDTAAGRVAARAKMTLSSTEQDSSTERDSSTEQDSSSGGLVLV